MANPSGVGKYSEYPKKQYLINRSFVNKKGLSNRYTSKNLLTFFFTLPDIAKIPGKNIFSKDGY